MTTTADRRDFESDGVRGLRDDLAVALRAAAHHGLAEGVCNHFSLELPDRSGRFLLNPRGLLRSEVRADDIVMVDGHGNKLAGSHAVEPTAMFIHAAIRHLCAPTRTTTASHLMLRRASGSPRRWVVPTWPSSATTAWSCAASAWLTPTTTSTSWSMVQVLAQSTGRPLTPVDTSIAARVRDQTLGERLQSELFFEALRRTLRASGPAS
jgi:hypothetical protein